MPAHKFTFIYTEELASLQHSILGQNPVTKQKHVIFKQHKFSMAYGCKRKEIEDPWKYWSEWNAANSGFKNSAENPRESEHCGV